MPGLAFGALALMPFLDTTPERRPSKRPITYCIMLLSISFNRLFNLGICRCNKLGKCKCTRCNFRCRLRFTMTLKLITI